MIKGATVEPALRPKFVLWVFLCSETLFVIILFVQCFSVYVYIVVLSMFVGTIFVDTHSVEDTSTYICGHSSANQKCCPVSYFDEHLILWVRSINNEIYPNFVTVNDDKIIVTGVECKEEKQSVVWRTYKRRKVSIVSRHILFEFAFRVIFFGKSMF